MITVSIYVQPNAKKSELVGFHDKALKLKIAAPPVDGEANDAVILFFSKSLKIPKSNIEIIRGLTSRHKTLQISGIDQATFDEFLQKLEILE